MSWDRNRPRLRVEERRYSNGLAKLGVGSIEVTVFDGPDEVATLVVKPVIVSLQSERRYEVEARHRRADMDGDKADAADAAAQCWTVAKTETAILPMPLAHQEDDRP